MKIYMWNGREATMVVNQQGIVFIQCLATKKIFESIFLTDAKKMFSHFQRDFVDKAIVIEGNDGVSIENMMPLSKFCELVPFSSWGSLCSDMCLFRVLSQICKGPYEPSDDNPDNPDLPVPPDLASFVNAVLVGPGYQHQ